MTEWARRWTAYWTGGSGHFTMSAGEDAGVMQALTFLDAGGRVDWNRVLNLRTASNFVLPPAGQSAVEPLAAKAAGAHESAYAEALEAAYAVGSVVLKELVAHWDQYRDKPPG
jgi:purine nucleoside permease